MAVQRTSLTSQILFLPNIALNIALNSATLFTRCDSEVGAYESTEGQPQIRKRYLKENSFNWIAVTFFPQSRSGRWDKKYPSKESVVDTQVSNEVSLNSSEVLLNTYLTKGAPVTMGWSRDLASCVRSSITSSSGSFVVKVQWHMPFILQQQDTCSYQAQQALLETESARFLETFQPILRIMMRLAKEQWS